MYFLSSVFCAVGCVTAVHFLQDLHRPSPGVRGLARSRLARPRLLPPQGRTIRGASIREVRGDMRRHSSVNLPACGNTRAGLAAPEEPTAIGKRQSTPPAMAGTWKLRLIAHRRTYK